MSRLFLWPLYVLSGWVPRRRDLWAFGSWGGTRFADNSAAFFRYCHGRLPDGVRLVWISRRRTIVRDVRRMGYEAHWIWSPRGVLACLRAGLYVFDSFSKDINFWTSRRAIKVNLWSGVPLKTFERDIDNPRSRYYRLFHGTLPERIAWTIMMPWHAVRPDLIIATSPETAHITRRAFDVPNEAVVVTGYPRNDVLFEPAEDAALPEPFARAIEQGGPVFLYLPTYRDSGKPFLNLDWPGLQELMERHGATFFFKLHPNDTSRVEGSHDRIVQLPIDIDVYDLLPHADALITDYSSILFDYLLLARPTVHYLPDLEEFVTSSRALNFDPVDVAVGPVCRTQEELSGALAEIARNGVATADRRPELRQRVNTYRDGRSNERVLALLQSRYLKTAPAAAPAVAVRS